MGGDWWRAVQVLALAYIWMGNVVSAGACFDMFPDKDIFLLAGSDLNLNCSLKATSPNPKCRHIIADFNVYNISITKQGSMEPSDLLVYHEAESTLAMTLPNVTFGDSGNYICRYGDNQTVVHAFRNIQVGEPPGAPENLTCIARGNEDLRCFFSLSKQPVNIPITWTMEFRLSESEHRKVNCSKTSDLGIMCVCPVDLIFDTETYQLLVEGINKDFTVHVNKSFQVENNESIVQPYPLRNLGYDLTNISSIVELHWDGPFHIAYWETLSFPLDYKIVVTCEWDNRTEWIESTKDESGRYDLRSHREYNLRGLIPFANYSITVQSRPTAAEGDIYWSNASHVNFTTPSEVSEHSVVVSAGSYLLLDCGPLMCPIIYWKNPARKYWSGPLIGYRFHISKVGRPEQSTIATTVHIDKRNIEDEPEYERVTKPWSEDVTGMAVSGTLKTKMLKEEGYLVQIMLINSEGVSWNSSQIQIPTWDTAQMLKPRWVSVEMVDSMLYMSWSLDPIYCDAVTSVTYYWCVLDTESPFNTSYVSCKEGFDWITVNITDGCGNETGSYIEKPYNQPNVKYAVSLKTTKFSGGIRWENFRFNKKDVPEKPLYSVEVNGTTLKVRLQYGEYYVSEGGRPTQYSVVYKECVENNHCTSGDLGETDTFIANFSNPLYTISNLKPGSTYQVHVKSKNSFGSSLDGDPMPVSVPKVSERSSDTSPILAAVLCPIAVLMGLSIVILLCRKKLRKYRKETKITVPGQHFTVTADGSYVERDPEKAIITKSADDHDSGKGSDSPGSSLGQLNQQQDKDGIKLLQSPQSDTADIGLDVNGYYPSNEGGQPSPTLSGYLRVGQGDSSNLPYKFEIFDDETDSCIEESNETNGFENKRKPGLCHDINEDPSIISGPFEEMNSPKITLQKNSLTTVKDLKALPQKSSESVTTLSDFKRSTEKTITDLGYGVKVSKHDTPGKIESVPNDPAEYSKATVNSDKDESVISNDFLEELQNEDGGFDDNKLSSLKKELQKKDISLNSDSVLPNPILSKQDAPNHLFNTDPTSVCNRPENGNVGTGLADQSCLNSNETSTNFDSSASFKDKDEVLFENFFKNSEVSHYRNPDDVSLDGSTCTEASDEESVETEDFSSIENNVSGNNEVSLSKPFSPETPQEVLEMIEENTAENDLDNKGNLQNDSEGENLDIEALNNTEPCDVPKNSVRQNCSDKENVTFESVEMKNMSESGQDDILSEESKSTSGMISLESYVKTGLGTVPNRLLENEKVVDGGNRETSKKGALAKIALKEVSRTVDGSLEVNKDNTRATQL